jgi:hypothetical protein
MSLKSFIASQSMFWIGMALLLLLIPRQFVGFFGVVLDGDVLILARLFAAELTALAIVSYYETSRNWPTVPRMTWLAYVLSNTIGFLSSLAAVLAGTLNERGWLIVVLYFLYAAVFVAVLVRNPEKSHDFK